MPSSRPLRILIPGGTGRVGFLLASYLHQQGHVVSTITRFPKPNQWEAIHWDAENIGEWASSLEGADAVINMATRYPQTTKLVADAIALCRHPPGVWINRSTTATCEMTEIAGPDAITFSTPATRQIVLRLSPVMTLGFGGFPMLFRLVRWGFGGDIGGGEQYMTWIHDLDFVRGVEFLINDEGMEGFVNVAAPFPLPNHQFMAYLREAWSSNHFGLGLPSWLVQSFCVLLGKQSGAILESRRVIPKKLVEAGFLFSFPEWETASQDLVHRWRQLHES